MTEYDRPRGILTEKDRRYLRDDVLPDSKQAKYERRKGTRKRIRNGIRDFPTIRFLPPEERKKIFQDMEAGDELYRELSAAVAVIKYACDDADLSIEDLLAEGVRLGSHPTRGDLTPPGENPHSPFEDPQNPMKTGRFKTLRDVDVDIEYEYSDSYYPAKLRERFLSGGELNDEELLVLVKSDEFDDEVAEELQQRPESIPEVDVE
jgi:hypothetical protein